MQSGWVAQLGAYDSLAAAKRKWATLTRAHNMLLAYTVSSDTVMVKGKNIYRLTVGSLSSRDDVLKLCRSLRAGRGSCFARRVSGKENVRWMLEPKASGS